MINKRGSIAVFLVYIITAMIGLTAAFIYASKQKAYTGICDGLLNLAQRSILSEYDITLYERYGLLAFEKNGMKAALEIGDYIDYSFERDVPVRKIQVSAGRHSMADINTLKAQITDYMKSEGVLDYINKNDENIFREEWEDRMLRNKSVIESLPSKSFSSGEAGLLEKIEAIKNQINSADEILAQTSDTYLLDKYILGHFKYATGGSSDEISFFQHEVEYILMGNYSNLENRKKVESALKIIRIAMNTAYLYSNEERYAQTLAAAELLNPAAAPATQAVIITTWATAEASNDIKLLLRGKTVPFVKTEASWATDLDSVLNNVSEGCIDTGNKKGLQYDDYMMILLHFQDEKIKLARVADLIQINMKAAQDRDFLMKTCSEGMITTAEIYGKVHTYETSY